MSDCTFFLVEEFVSPSAWDIVTVGTNRQLREVLLPTAQLISEIDKLFLSQDRNYFDGSGHCVLGRILETDEAHCLIDRLSESQQQFFHDAVMIVDDETAYWYLRDLAVYSLETAMKALVPDAARKICGEENILILRDALYVHMGLSEMCDNSPRGSQTANPFCDWLYYDL